jgi:hypothetical protein
MIFMQISFWEVFFSFQFPTLKEHFFLLQPTFLKVKIRLKPEYLCFIGIFATHTNKVFPIDRKPLQEIQFVFTFKIKFQIFGGFLLTFQ